MQTAAARLDSTRHCLKSPRGVSIIYIFTTHWITSLQPPTSRQRLLVLINFLAAHSKDKEKAAKAKMPFKEDTCVTLVPKFKIKEGMTDEFMANVPKFTELVEANEQDSCVHYAFVGPTEDGFIICREGYKDADGLLFHLKNCDEPLKEALRCADIVSLEVQGPAAELEKLKEPMAGLGPTYYELKPGGFRAA